MDGNRYCCGQCQLLLGPEVILDNGVIVPAKEIAEATMAAFGGILCYECATEMEKEQDDKDRDYDDPYAYEVTIM